MFDITKAYIREREKDEQRMVSAKALQKIQGEEDFINRDENIERRRLWKIKQLEAQQMEIVDLLQKKQRKTEIQQQMVFEQDRIARELKQKKDSEMAQEALRKRIRESSDEIRQLESKLRAAYVGKSQRAQIAEKRAVKYDQMMEDNDYHKALETERRKVEDIEEASAQDLTVRVRQYQEELDRQIEEKNQVKEQLKAEKMEQRRQIELELCRQKEEDEKVLLREKLHKEELKATISNDLALRKKEREMRQRELEEEERRIALDEERLRARQTEIKEAKESRQAELEAVQLQLGELMRQKEKERKELDDIRMELNLEEEKTRAFEHERVEEERRRKARADLQADKQKQFEEHQRRKVAQQEEEEAIRRVMLAKFAEDDKLEQLSNQRRRQKMMEHRKAADNFIEERRRYYLKLKVEEEEKAIREREAQKAYESLVEEERLQLLERHAPNLMGYLTKGVIKTERDLERLGDEAKAYYGHRPGPFEP